MRQRTDCERQADVENAADLTASDEGDVAESGRSIAQGEVVH